MNKMFKVVWSAASQTWVAVSELQKAKGKSTKSRTLARPALVALSVGAGTLLGSSAVMAATAVTTPFGATNAIVVDSADVSYTIATSQDKNTIITGVSISNAAGTQELDEGTNNLVVYGSDIDLGDNFGGKAESTAVNTTVIGSNITLAANNNYTANPKNAAVSDAVVLGNNIVASSGADGNVENAISDRSVTAIQNSLVAGNNITASMASTTYSGSAINGVALGNDLTVALSGANTQNSITIGNEITNQVDRSVAMGNNISLQPWRAGEVTNIVAIGNDLNTTTNNKVMIGKDIQGTSTARVIAIGEAIDANQTKNGDIPVVTGTMDRNWTVTGTQIAIGYNVVGRQNSIIIGENTSVTGYGATAIGMGAISAVLGTAVGSDAWATGARASAFGDVATASGEGSTALGWLSNASGQSSVAVGRSAQASGRNGVGLGTFSNASGRTSIALGQWANSTAEGATAISPQSNANGSDSIAMGRYSSSSITSPNGIAIGTYAAVNGSQAITVGYRSAVNADYSGLVGDSSTVNGTYSYAVGNNNTIETNSTYVLGSNITTTLDNSVFLGDGAATFTQDKTENGIHKAAGTAKSAYSFGTLQDETNATTYENLVKGVDNVVGVVSIGNATATRQLQGVAAGVISANSTDAINGSQLYWVAQQVAESAQYSWTVAENAEYRSDIGSNDVVEFINGKGTVAEVIAGNLAEEFTGELTDGATAFDKDGNLLISSPFFECEIVDEDGLGLSSAEGCQHTGTYYGWVYAEGTDKAGQIYSGIAYKTAPTNSNTTVTFHVKQSPILINDGKNEYTTAEDADGNTVIKQGDTYVYPNGTSYTGDVKNETTNVYNYTAGDTINYVDGNGTKANVSVHYDENGNADGYNVTYDVDTGVSNVTTGGTATQYTDKDGNPLTKNEDGSYTNANGDVINVTDVVDNGDKIATVGDIVNTINNVGWFTKAVNPTEDSDTDDQKISAGQRVDFAAGAGVELKREVTDGNVTYTYATKTSSITSNNASSTYITYKTEEGDTVIKQGDSYVYNNGTTYEGDVNNIQEVANNYTYTNGDQINYTDGNGTKANVSVIVDDKGNAVGYNVTYDMNIVDGNGTTVTSNEDGSIQIDVDTGVSNVTTGGTATQYTTEDGKPVTQEVIDGETVYKDADGNVIEADKVVNNGDKIATVGDIVNTINNVGWFTNSSTATGNTEDQKISAGQRVDFEAGAGVTLDRQVDDNGNVTYTYAAKSSSITSNGTNVTYITYETPDGETLVKEGDNYYTVDGDGNKNIYEGEVKNVTNNYNYTAGDSVNYVDGKNTKANVSVATDENGNAVGYNVTYDVDFNVENGNGTNLTFEDGTLTVDIDTGVSNVTTDGTATQYTDKDGNPLTKNEDGSYTNANGDVINVTDVVDNGDKIATVGDIVNTINNVGWFTKAVNPTEDSDTDDQKISAGQRVDFAAGAGVELKREVTDGNVTYTYATKTSSITSNNASSTYITYKTEEGDTVIKQGDSYVYNNGTTYEGDVNNIQEVTNNYTYTNGDQINYTDGNGTKANVSVIVDDKGNAVGYNVTYDMNIVDGNGTKVTPNSDGSIQVDINTTTGSVNPNGTVAIPDNAGSSFLNASEVVNLVNKAGFNVTIGSDKTVFKDQAGKADEQITAGDVITLQSGKNLVVKQEGSTITYATDENVSFSNLNVTGNTTLGNLTIAPNSTVDFGGNTIGNVSAGANTTTTTPITMNSGTETSDKQPETILDLNNSNGSNVVTVDDLRNYGWVVATPENEERGVVRNADTVNFIGDKAISVTGSQNTNGTYNVTVTANTGELSNEANGKVVLKDLASANQELSNAIAELVSATTPEEKSAAQAKVDSATANVTRAGNALATAENVQNAVNNSGWTTTLTNGSTVLVNPSDQVNYVNGNGTEANVTVMPVIAGTEFKDSVGNTVYKSGDNSYIYANGTSVADPNSVKETTIYRDVVSVSYDVAKTELQISNGTQTHANGTVANQGEVIVPTGAEGDKFVNATNLAQTINNAGWNVDSKAVENSTGKVTTGSTSKPTKVSAGNTVNVNAGNNIVITRSDRDIAIATSLTPTFNNVTVNNDLTVKEGANVDMGNNQIHNVKAGTADTDAVNVAQLKDEIGGVNNRINKLNKQRKAGHASGIAAASLLQAYREGQSVLTAGAGQYQGQTAVAVGYSRLSDSGKVGIKLSLGTNSQKEVSAGVGVGYFW